VIYLFYGSDIEKARSKAFEWIAKAREKEPNLSYIRLAREELSEAALEEVISAGGLFARRMLVLLDDPFPVARKSDEDDGEEGESSSLVEDHIAELAKSENAIVILAPKLLAAKAKKLEAKAAKVYKFDAAARALGSRGFNSGLVNALAERDALKLWLEIERSLLAGDAPEQLHGLLHWKARDLMQKGGRAWSAEDARKLSLDLITLLADSRRKSLSLSESLERFALSL